MVDVLTKKVLKVMVLERGGTVKYSEVTGRPPPDHHVLKT